MEKLREVFLKAGIGNYGVLFLSKDDINRYKEIEKSTINEISLRNNFTEFESNIENRSFFNYIEEKTRDDEFVLMASIAVPYDISDCTIPNGFGKIAGFAWGEDYHIRVRRLMNAAITEFILNYKIKSDKFECFVDTSPFIDREIAYLCGLGSYGKNHMLIHNQLGTNFNIGFFYIILDKPLEIQSSFIKERLYDGCKDCDLCSIACPSKICGNERMNRMKCVSYLTQTKKELNEHEMKLIGNRLYGCDTCQIVCKSNMKLDKSKELYALNLSNLSHMTQRQFKEMYGNTSFAWRGVTIFKRNAKIVEKNSSNY